MKRKFESGHEKRKKIARQNEVALVSNKLHISMHILIILIIVIASARLKTFKK